MESNVPLAKGDVGVVSTFVRFQGGEDSLMGFYRFVYKLLKHNNLAYIPAFRNHVYSIHSLAW